jgi:citrate synthase
MLYQTSKLHPEDGIEYRQHTIREIVELAPKKREDGAPLPEAVLWLLLSGEYPT